MTIEAFAPGRLCLFGEHQEQLGLSVLALAIDRGVRVRLEPDARSATFELQFEEAAPDADDAQAVLAALAAALHAAGARWPGGGRLVVRRELPLAAGCGLRSALVVACGRALAEFAGASGVRLAEPRRLAEFAAQAAPSGSSAADFVTSAVGGLLHQNFGPTPFVQELPALLDGFVLIESGEPPATSTAVARTRGAVAAAVAALRAVDPALDLAAVSYEAIWNVIVEAGRDEERERLVFATLFDRDLLLAALRFLAETPFESSGRARIGELLDEHHVRLRDALRISTPRVDELRQAALAAGALGAKLNGEGGGSLFAYAPGREEAVVAAVERVGARARVVRASAGARITSPGRA